MTGLLAAAVVLVLATGFGLWRRRTDGALRPVSAPAPSPDGSAGSAAGSATSATSAASAAGAGSAAGSAAGAGADRVPRELLAALGVEPAPATLLQFSSAFCQPCRATRRVLGEVVALLPAARHVEVDAESHLDAVRALGIWRTPTTLVLDAGGRIVRRAAGVPGKAQVIAALAELLPGGGGAAEPRTLEP
ncbi:TlpA family protein disulfide reductase [Spirilliplanes yamanashiensis]|uniref:Thioredoxin domain-containing protein n=1 Tax=Spirilliplanes yamanashiensis TaxID=42233 RepID=A0A8J4DJM9_9ACTN|nr:thioredoxin family protein [Spirilliplanes yamanashiensis]MDP9816865.1 thiol-disulfide isomerase/thioredoxin [Spirilliplanes yamanashiensis]GIJ03479.1 hypothetical protein Sya03_28310 [Spirilliplanes yamanashiensis]